MKLLEYLLSAPPFNPTDAGKEDSSPHIVTSVPSVTAQAEPDHQKTSTTGLCDLPRPTPEPAGCAPERYEIEPGRQIHQPWVGKCKAKFQMPEPRQVERTCWHCLGSLRCGCITCAEGLAADARAECAVCRGSGKALVWVH